MKMNFILAIGLTFLTTIVAVAQQPTLFAPNIVSTEFMETTATFAPDGKTVYFTRSDFQFKDNTIMESKLINNRWSEPRVASFSGIWRDSEPFVSPDGAKLFFVSNRPVKSGDAPLVATSQTTGATFPGANIWYAPKKGDDWGEAVHVDVDANGSKMMYNPSVARNGNLYFSAFTESKQQTYAIYRSVYENGVYGRAERLPFNDPKSSFMDPSVSPDEKFIVFAFSGTGTVGLADIYIVKQKDGVWQTPMNLGESVNSKTLENAPCLAPDGKTVFFTSARIPEVAFPKTRETGEGVSKRLHNPLNGSRNIWRVDISRWLSE